MTHLRSLLPFVLVVLLACNDDSPVDPGPGGGNPDDPDDPQNVESFCSTVTGPPPDSEASSVHGLTLQVNRKWPNGSTLRVGFIGGTADQINLVQQIAPIWSQFANIQFVFIMAGQPSDIRVAFVDTAGNYSKVGTGARSVGGNEETMNLQNVDQQTILHEFGHALGLRHEHQHPENGIQWDKEGVYADFKRINWSRDTVDEQVFKAYSRNHTNFSQYDPRSIMHYRIPATWTTNGYSVDWNSELSEKDECFIGELYPRNQFIAFADFGAGIRGGEGWYVGDFNGDGKDDVLRYLNGNGGAEVAISTGTRFQSPIEWSGAGVRGGEGWYVGDFNGDGRDDVLRYKNSNGGAEVAISTGTRFQSPMEWSGAGVRGGEGWYVGDFNGDGKDDVLRYLNGNGGAEVAISTGSRFQSPIEWSGAGVRGGEGWYVGDFNGDGRDDILRYKNGNGGAEVAMSTGTRFQSPVEWSGSGERGGEGWYVGDYDGDDVYDLVRFATSGDGGAQVLVSSSSRFGSPATWSNHPVRGGRGWYVGDFNGDGTDDLLRYLNENGGAVVYLSGGDCFPDFR